MDKPVLSAFVRLLYSRKFLLAVAGVIAVVLQESLPLELAQAIQNLVLVLIGAIALEDAAEKFNS